MWYCSRRFGGDMSHLHASIEEDDKLWVESLILKHIDLNDGGPISLFEIHINLGNNAVDICVSDWVLEISSYFDEKYGVEKGLEITKLVVGNCLTMGHTIH